MTSLQRLLTALQHREPDRAPYMMLVTMHGAKALGMPIREYFSKAEHVVEGQLLLRRKFRHDAIYAFFYAALEIEPWGGEVVFTDDGPPNSGRPFLESPGEIRGLKPPRVSDSESLNKVLRAITLLKQSVGEDAPIFGVVMSPFSLPVMQMGFENYLNLMYEDRSSFHHLMEANQEFCASWANAQLEAGAAGIVYFDPVSSPQMIPRSLYPELAHPIAKRMIAEIKGPVATHFASGSCLPILEDVITTGTIGVGVSAEEDLGSLKSVSRGKITLIGNLNGLEMRRWTPQEAEIKVKNAIAKAARGGGFILADNHGEIPYQVPDETLSAIADAVDKWGHYPLEWVAVEK